MFLNMPIPESIRITMPEHYTDENFLRRAETELKWSYYGHVGAMPVVVGCGLLRPIVRCLLLVGQVILLFGHVGTVVQRC